MASLAEILAAKKKKTEEEAAKAEAPFPEVVKAAPSQTEDILAQVEAAGQEEVAPPAVELRKVPRPNIQTTRILPDADDLIPRIEALESLSDDTLEDEMKLLKESLLQNPEAARLLLPEQIGMMVAALRRIVGESIAAASAPKEKKAKVKHLSKEEIENITDF
jgi:hypothetical protein